MRRRNRKGFTLAELLIVVAVIAVLTAVAIPTFTDQLEKSRQAVDIANLRDAYAIAKMAEITQMFNDGETLAAAADNALSLTCWCDPDSGQLIKGPISQVATTFAAGSGESLLGHATTTVARLNIDSLSAIPNYELQLSYNDLYKGTTQKAIAVHFAKNAQSEYTVTSVYYTHTLRAWSYLLLSIPTINDRYNIHIPNIDWFNTENAKFIRQYSPILYDATLSPLTREDITINNEQGSNLGYDSNAVDEKLVTALSYFDSTNPMDIDLFISWRNGDTEDDDPRCVGFENFDDAYGEAYEAAVEESTG